MSNWLTKLDARSRLWPPIRLCWHIDMQTHLEWRTLVVVGYWLFRVTPKRSYDDAAADRKGSP